MNHQEIEAEYIILRPIVDAACLSIVKELESLFSTEDIRLAVEIQRRTKTLESILDKIDSKIVKVHTSIKEIQDIAWLRIIVLEKTDLEKVVSLLEQRFEIDKHYNTQQKLKEDQFWYASIHLVVKLKNSWLEVPSFKHCKGLLFEIQVRTLAQHSWAEMSKRLQYKREKDAPPALRRSVHRMAALLELIDEEFHRLVLSQSEYVESLTENSQELLLNTDTLKFILDEKFPVWNKKGDENYAELLEEINKIGIERTTQLIKIIEAHLDQVLDTEKKIINQYLQNPDFAKGAKSVHIDVKWTKHTYHLEKNHKKRLDAWIYFTQAWLLRTAIEYYTGEMVYDMLKKWHKIQWI